MSDIYSSTSESSDDDDNQIIFDTMNSSIIFKDILSSDGSDDSVKVKKWGGSSPGRSLNVRRNFTGAETMLLNHYFNGEDSIYNEEFFERRFLSPQCVINRVFDAILK